MTSQDLKESATPSPLQDVFQIYLQSFEIFAAPVQPFFKSYARANLEFWELASRRSRAAIELPARFSTCLSPAHMMVECQSYMTIAARDYADAMRRATSAVGPVFEASAIPEHAKKLPSAATVRPLYRDIIIVEPDAEQTDKAANVRLHDRRQRAKQVA